MAKTPLDLPSIRAVRRIREGLDGDAVCRDLGISPARLRHISAAYESVPDDLLSAMERVLTDRERLRRLVDELMHAGVDLP
jgi:hypothetical protein